MAGLGRANSATGKPAEGCGQDERGGHGSADPWLVQVAADDPAGSGLDRQRQLIKQAVRQEAGGGAVQGRRRTGRSCWRVG